VAGMTELNGRRFRITDLSANTFSLDEEDSSGYTAYSSGGSAKSENFRLESAAAPTTADPNVITWTGVTGVRRYNVYKALNNVYGFIGTAEELTFNDTGIEEDTTTTPPAHRNPFFNTGNYPSTVAFHQQRRVFANSDNDVEDVWASRSADFSNFTRREPIQDDDTVNWNLAGQQVNEVQSMINLTGTLIVMTTGGEWSVGGNVSGILTPGNINPRQYSYNGSGKLQPLVINGTAIYLQGRQNILRDLNAESDFESFKGDDLTLFSNHLFENKTIVDMAFQQIPHSTGWFVRSDGVLLGLTYLREQEILAWHRHDFDGGTVENVAVIPEGNEDVVYVVVKRTIDSKTVRYVERLASRINSDVEDYIFVDSSVTVDGTNTGSTTMTLTGGTDWDHYEDLTLTASASHFASTDVGTKEIHLNDSTGDIVRLRITAFSSATVVTARGHKIVPTTMRSTALTTWGDAVAVVGGLWHLEGEQISALGDGFVKASVNNDSYTAVTVSSGQAALDKKHVVMQVGLPITADLETLNVDTAQLETLADKKSMSTKVTATVESTSPFWAGHKPPTDDSDDPLENLTEMKLRNEESQEVPTDLKTENINVNITSTYTNGARVFLRNIDPTPCSILSIHAGGYFPFRG
jgi:hypothetical protein